MATQTDIPAGGRTNGYRWLSGLIAGLVGAVVTGLLIQFVIERTVLTVGVPSGFGTAGLVAGWLIFLGVGAVVGLAYALLALHDRIGEYVRRPQRGTYVGLGYGIVLWLVAIVVVPLWVGGDVGQYAVNLRGVLSFALLGGIIGFVYGVSPYT